LERPSSWRDLLKSIISDPGERERLANEIGVRSITLSRWITGESTPHPQNLRQLLQALPKQQRDLLSFLLQEEHIDLTDLGASESADEIDYQFIKQVFEARATTPSNLLFWTLCRKVLLHALRRLDPERIGMAITVVQCMPASSEGKVRSLRERMGLGTPPWSADLEHQAMFLGAESLAGYVVAHCQQAAINDLRENRSFLPAYQTEYEVSALAHPVLYANRVAGCLLLSSTQPNYFLSPSRRSLIADYAQLIALAFTPEEFVPPEQIALQLMPPAQVQYELFATFHQRIIEQMRASANTKRIVTHMEAEQLVWQQLEEELIHRIRFG
jgi:transcriptional regulator with XRE-family HTH domain